MAAGKIEGGVRIAGQVKRSCFSSTAGALFIFSTYLIFFCSVVLGVYKVENDGVLIYISDSTPTEEQQEVIDQWRRVHFVDFRYEGPEEYKAEVEKSLESCGVFPGGVKPFFVKLYEGFDRIAVWMWKDGKSWDNFSSPSSVEDLEMVVKDGVSHFFSCISIPKKSFLIYITGNSIEAKITDFNGRPVTFRRKEKEFYNVFIDDEATSMKMGFHKIGSTFVFVGKDEQKISSMLFFKDAKMVYPVEENEFVILKENLLLFPDGKKIVVSEEPVYVGKNFIIYRNSIVFRGKLRELNSTVLGSNGKVVLEADGTVEDIEGKWKMKVFGIPVEWYFKSNVLYVLDISGILREFDLISKKVLLEKRYAGAYGFDFFNGSIVIGVPERILFDGKKLNAENFCVARNQIWEYRNCVRLHTGLAYVSDNGKIKIIGKSIATDLYRVRLINGWLILIGKKGTWVVNVGN